MTKEFEEGMLARENGLDLIHNPYFLKNREKNQDWSNGWRFENWRIKHDAIRKEADRQIQAD